MATATPHTEPGSAGASTGYQPRVGPDIPRDVRDRTDPAHAGPVSAATFPELIGRLINDFSALVDKQVELAKQEVREDIEEAVGSIKILAIGAGVVAATGLLILIWAWTALIWFFNWIGALINPGLGWIGWLLGLLLPALIAFIGFKKLIQPGFRLVKMRPLKRTRSTLKEDVEWVRNLRTPNAK